MAETAKCVICKKNVKACCMSDSQEAEIEGHVTLIQICKKCWINIGLKKGW